MEQLLEFTRYGPDTGIPLVIAHGLFGSARNWGVLSKRFAETRPVICVDMRNHGDSFWSDAHQYTDLAIDLANVIQHLGGKADLLGHSMGGKAAMVLAISQPDLIRNLIVADIAPVTYPATPSAEVAAMKAVDLSVVSRRSDADLQLQRHIADPAVRAFLLQSVVMGDTPHWKLNLDVLDDAYGDIRGFPDVTGQFDGPCLFLNGALSKYVRDENHAIIKRLFPAAEFETLAGAGHWLHAEKPREFESAVKAFLPD